MTAHKPKFSSPQRRKKPPLPSGLTSPQGRAERILSSLANVPDFPLVGTVIKDRSPTLIDSALAKQWHDDFKKAQAEWAKMPPKYFKGAANIDLSKPLPEISPPREVQPETTDWSWTEKMKAQYPESFAGCTVSDMIVLRNLLRSAWDDRDLHRRQWFCFRLRNFYAGIIRRQAMRSDPEQVLLDAKTKHQQLTDILALDKAAEAFVNLLDREAARDEIENGAPPVTTEFESAVAYFQQSLSYALHCERPGCVTPYFFNATKGTKYCSDSCKNWARKESKKKWWNDNQGKGAQR